VRKCWWLCICIVPSGFHPPCHCSSGFPFNMLFLLRYRQSVVIKSIYRLFSVWKMCRIAGVQCLAVWHSSPISPPCHVHYIVPPCSHLLFCICLSSSNLSPLRAVCCLELSHQRRHLSSRAAHQTSTPTITVILATITTTRPLLPSAGPLEFLASPRAEP
jgi:hypothetical protein